MAKEKMTTEEAQKAKQSFEDFKNYNYSAEDADKVLKNEEKIMVKMNDKNLSKYFDQVKVFFSMVRDYATGKYKKVPVSTIVVIICTLLFVLSPIDIIPDFIPIAGFLDDATVLGLCVASFGSAIKAYEDWKNKNEN